MTTSELVALAEVLLQSAREVEERFPGAAVRRMKTGDLAIILGCPYPKEASDNGLYYGAVGYVDIRTGALSVVD